LVFFGHVPVKRAEHYAFQRSRLLGLPKKRALRQAGAVCRALGCVSRHLVPLVTTVEREDYGVSLGASATKERIMRVGLFPLFMHLLSITLAVIALLIEWFLHSKS
jgi:hypothetical protein